MKRTSVMVMALCAMLFGAGAAQATPNPKPGWEQSKLTEQAELEGCLTDTPDMSAQCWTRFNAALELIDAAAAKARTGSRYVDNGDGTVSDLNTGLMWEQTTSTCTGEVTCYTNSYTWSNTWQGRAPDGAAFTVFLGTLNNGAAPYNNGHPSPITGCFANHCDWRLPSIVELLGIVDLSVPGCSYSGKQNCIDPIFGPTANYYYWSVDSRPDFPGARWFMSFNYPAGGGSSANTNDAFCVRAVRFQNNVVFGGRSLQNPKSNNQINQ